GDWIDNYHEYLTNSNPHDTMVIAWGNNSGGQCNVPQNLRNVASIAGGQEHSLALRTGGTLAVWGGNSDGQTNIPSGLSNVVAIAAGTYHNLALRANGTIAAWGGWEIDNHPSPTVPSGL